eukprot:TRINITY_DN3441_c0_g2_i1.p2 TRINITY_DN3441_c0_g2~~TRINITY_DN3441_c0_g2_i1.p2  ORF type:complete len:118 (-),score=0.27 TRINITY_DN3441_c0_g2_i1:628-981(-)
MRIKPEVRPVEDAQAFDSCQEQQATEVSCVQLTISAAAISAVRKSMLEHVTDGNTQKILSKHQLEKRREKSFLRFWFIFLINLRMIIRRGPELAHYSDAFVCEEKGIKLSQHDIGPT